MPKLAVELSPLAVKRLDSPGTHAVGGVAGLMLQITATGARSWLLRAYVYKRRREIGLGAYPGVTLAAAREEAAELKRIIRVGRDPLEERRAAREAGIEASKRRKTFSECAVAYIASRKDWRNDKHAKQWTATLEKYAYPSIGGKLVQEITSDHIKSILEPIWTSKHETASRVRGRIERILDYAKSERYRDGDNPAALKGNLHERLGRVKKDVKHHAALPYLDLAPFMANLRLREGMSARALEFAILCAARSGEVRGATWAEIDLDRAMWTIPKERMKAAREHVVPLSQQALALLNALPRIKGSQLIFPAPRNGSLSDMSLTAVLKRMELSNLTQHGFRSTFREWAGETTSHPREVIEHALAHQLADKAEAAYQRGSLLPKRAALMADWGNYCATIDDEMKQAVTS